MKREKTAVDFLAEQMKGRISKTGTRGVIVIQTIDEVLDDIIAQAKAMEKEQIIDAYDCTNSMAMNGEQYYNETYGDEKNND